MVTTKRPALSRAGLVAVVLLASAVPGTADTGEPDPGTQGPRFLDPDGNFLTVASGAVWWVDHTRSFSRVPSLPEESRVGRIGRDFWLQLQGLPDERIAEALSPHLGDPEIEGVLQRRRLLIALLESRLEKKGPGRVLFSLAYAGRRADRGTDRTRTASGRCLSPPSARSTHS